MRQEVGRRITRGGLSAIKEQSTTHSALKVPAMHVSGYIGSSAVWRFRSMWLFSVRADGLLPCFVSYSVVGARTRSERVFQKPLYSLRPAFTGSLTAPHLSSAQSAVCLFIQSLLILNVPHILGSPAVHLPSVK